MSPLPSPGKTLSRGTSRFENKYPENQIILSSKSSTAVHDSSRQPAADIGQHAVSVSRFRSGVAVGCISRACQGIYSEACLSVLQCISTLAVIKLVFPSILSCPESLTSLSTTRTCHGQTVIPSRLTPSNLLTRLRSADDIAWKIDLSRRLQSITDTSIPRFSSGTATSHLQPEVAFQLILD